MAGEGSVRKNCTFPHIPGFLEPCSSLSFPSSGCPERPGLTTVSTAVPLTPASHQRQHRVTAVDMVTTATLQVSHRVISREAPSQHTLGVVGKCVSRLEGPTEQQCTRRQARGQRCHVSVRKWGGAARKGVE